MKPSIRTGQTPSFYDLPSNTFEEMCRDLFQQEPNISTCDIYGIPGQSQEGIDVKAYRISGDGIEVGQCKCYKDFPPSKIRAASDKFFKYWDSHWKDRDVRRFILFVACELNSKQRVKEVNKQKERFKRHGIEYEAWSGPVIRNKLRPHEGIVATYLDPAEYWIKEICGKISSPSASMPGLESFSASISNAIIQTAINSSVEMERELLEHRTLWRHGQRRKAYRWARSIKKDTRWSQLADKSKIKLLCFAALLELDHNRINVARQLAKEAKSIAPSHEIDKLQARIAFHDKNIEQAKTYVEGSSDLGARNLLVALCLDSQDLHQAHRLLNSPSLLHVNNAETHRLRALYHLLNHDIKQAYPEILQALQMEPNWTSIQFAAALIEYFHAVVLVGLSKPLPPVPLPVPWPFIKRDSGSLVLLEKAGRTFDHLLDSHELNADMENQVRAWRLAALASHPDFQSEANTYCQELISQDPTHPIFFEWAVGRNYDIDFDVSKKAIWELVEKNEATLSQVQALYQLHFTENDQDSIIKLLDKTEKLFVATNQQQIRSVWYGHAILIKEGTTPALTYIEQSEFSDELDDLKTEVLRQKAEEEGDRNEVKTILEDGYKSTQNPYTLFEMCQWNAQQKDWEAIVKWGDHLLGLLPTGDALALVVNAHFQLNRFSDCLNYIQNYRGFYRSLPSHLKRIESQCALNLGDHAQAIRIRQEIVQESPTIHNLLDLTLAYQRVGDSRYIQTASRLLEHPDLDAVTALQLAHDLPDTWLAAKLLQRRLIVEELPADLVSVAFHQALTLGLRDNVVKDLEKRLNELGPGEHSGYYHPDWDEITEWVQQSHQNAIEITELYQKGAGPIHSVAASLKLNLADWYHTLLKNNRAVNSPLYTPAIYSRYAVREIIEGPPEDMRLIMDVTAVFVAAHLDILDDVVQAFGPVYITLPLMGLLGQLQRNLSEKSSQRVKVQQSIHDAIQQGRIHIETAVLSFSYPELANKINPHFATSLEHALTSNGYLVTVLPLRHLGKQIELLDFPDEVAERIVDLPAVLASLRQEGPLSETAYKRACDEIGAAEPITAVPRQRMPLYFYGNSLDYLVRAGVLDEVCARFVVHVEVQELERIEQMLTMRSQASETLKWLIKVQERISFGLNNSGDFKLLPYMPNQELVGSNNSIEEQCFTALLNYESQANDAIWVDDRWINKHLRINELSENRIVDSVDVLAWLLNKKCLSQASYYGYLTQLRAANVRYMPVTADEIYYHLQQAHISDFNLAETNELITLRRYVAACILQGRHLQNMPISPDAYYNHGEIPYLLGITRASIAAIYKIWASDEPDNTCLIRTNWIMQNLYLGHAGMVTTSGVNTAITDKQRLESLNLEIFLLQPIMTWPQAPLERMKRYYQWVDQRIVMGRIDDGTILKTAVDTLYSHIESIQAVSLDEKESQTLIGRAIYQGATPKFQNLLAADEAWQKQYLEGLGSAITVNGDMPFDASEFVGAVKAALEGDELEIEILDEKTIVSLKLTGPNTFLFSHPQKGDIPIQDELLRLLSNSLEDRENALRTHRHWFEGMSDDDFESEVMTIANLQDDFERFDLYKALLDNNLDNFYRNLPSKLRKGCEIDELLPPSPISMMRYYRLSLADGRSWPTALEESAEQLVKQNGLGDAIYRLCAFPIPLPSTIIEGIAALSPSDRHDLIHRLVNTTGSPVSQMHILHILIRFGGERSSYHRLARKIINRMLFSDAWEQEFLAFQALLKWTYARFSRWQDAREEWSLTTQMTMSWTHAHYLFSAFVYSNYRLKRLHEIFVVGGVTEIEFERPNEVWFDASLPLRGNIITFILSGLTYAFDNVSIQPLFDQIVQRLTYLVHFEFENVLLLRPGFFHVNVKSNALDGFLGFLGEGGSDKTLWKELFSDDLTADRCRERLEFTIEALIEDDSRVFAWDTLFQTLQDHAPPDGFEEVLRLLFQKTDYVSLFKNDTVQGLLPIRVATSQSRHVADGVLLRHLKEQLMQLVEVVGSETDMDEANEHEAIFLDCAMSLALVHTEDNLPLGARYAAIIDDFIASRGSVSPFTAAIVQQFYENLPVSQAHHLAPLFVRIRAMRD